MVILAIWVLLRSKSTNKIIFFSTATRRQKSVCQHETIHIARFYPEKNDLNKHSANM